VISVFTASSPLLVAGVVLVAGTAAWLNWYAFGLGIWLIAVAAFSGFAGPAAVNRP
jgi:type IV secretory pathway TrbD component